MKTDIQAAITERTLTHMGKGPSTSMARPLNERKDSPFTNGAGKIGYPQAIEQRETLTSFKN